MAQFFQIFLKEITNRKGESLVQKIFLRTNLLEVQNLTNVSM